MRGIPAVLIATDVFNSVLEATRDLGGVPDARWAEVPHPLLNLDREQVRSVAALAAEQIIDILLGPDAR